MTYKVGRPVYSTRLGLVVALISWSLIPSTPDLYPSILYKTVKLAVYCHNILPMFQKKANGR
jgi:hypothetical protein